MPTLLATGIGTAGSSSSRRRRARVTFALSGCCELLRTSRLEVLLLARDVGVCVTCVFVFCWPHRAREARALIVCTSTRVFVLCCVIF